MVEHAAVNRRVVGSSPTGGARRELLIKVLMGAFLFYLRCYSRRLLTGSQACAASGRKSKRVEQEKTQSNVSGNEQCDNVFDRTRRWFESNRGSQGRGSHQEIDGSFLYRQCEWEPKAERI